MDRFVVFDFDGTIVDSKSHFLKVFNDVIKEYGHSGLDEKEFDIISAKATELSLFKSVRLLGVPYYKIPLIICLMPRIALKIQNTLRHSLNSVKLVEGIEHTIYELKDKGYRLSIISTNSASNITGYLESKGIDVFESIYPSKGLLGKTRTLNKFIKDSSIKKDDMVYLGDELRDIVACKVAGVRVIAVTWGFNTVEVLSGGAPDFIAHSPKELTGVIDRIFDHENVKNRMAGDYTRENDIMTERKRENKR